VRTAGDDELPEEDAKAEEPVPPPPSFGVFGVGGDADEADDVEEVRSVVTDPELALRLVTIDTFCEPCCCAYCWWW